MESLDGRWLAAASGGAPPRRQAGPWWQPWWLALRSPLWLVLLAALCGLGLLLAFQQVVRQGVEQSQLRQQQASAHADSIWRCNALRGANERESCRAQLDATRSVEATVQNHSGSGLITAAQLGR